MKVVAPKTEFQSQQYEAFWPAVLMSDRAKARHRDLVILYDGFNAAFEKTLAHLMEERRQGRSAKSKISVAEVVGDNSVPSGIRMSYTFAPDGLMICDLWTPLQPSLFG